MRLRNSQSEIANDIAPGLMESSEPFFSRDSCLPQQSPQQAHANISIVWIGDNYGQVIAPHLGVASSRVRAFEPEFSKSPDEFAPRN